MARPTEIRAIADLLMEGHENPEELAKEVIKLLDALRAERPYYTVIVYWPGNPGAWFSYGPFPTVNKGQEALAKGKIPTAAIDRARNIVVRTMSPEYAQERAEA